MQQWLQRSGLTVVLMSSVLAGISSAQQGRITSVVDESGRVHFVDESVFESGRVQVPDESLIVGKTIVKFGASKDSVISVLAIQYVVKPLFENCKENNAVCRAYNVYERDNSIVGMLEFDAQDRLVTCIGRTATRTRIPQ